MTHTNTYAQPGQHFVKFIDFQRHTHTHICIYICANSHIRVELLVAFRVTPVRFDQQLAIISNRCKLRCERGNMCNNNNNNLGNNI